MNTWVPLREDLLVQVMFRDLYHTKPGGTGKEVSGKGAQHSHRIHLIFLRGVLMETAGQANSLKNPFSLWEPTASTILGGERAGSGAFIPLNISSLVFGPGTSQHVEGTSVYRVLNLHHAGVIHSWHIWQSDLLKVKSDHSILLKDYSRGIFFACRKIQLLILTHLVWPRFSQIVSTLPQLGLLTVIQRFSIIFSFPF